MTVSQDCHAAEESRSSTNPRTTAAAVGVDSGDESTGIVKILRDNRMMAVPSTGSVQCEQRPLREEEETMSATPRDHRPTERYQDENDESSSIFTTLANFVATLLVPFLLQFLFGGFALLKTLVWGYCLQSAVHVLSCAEDTVGIPSALLGIAVLTLVAMLVHPDGLTWIFARSVRYVLSSLWTPSRGMRWEVLNVLSYHRNSRFSSHNRIIPRFGHAVIVLQGRVRFADAVVFQHLDGPRT